MMKAIRVHGLMEARTVVETAASLGVPVTVVSARGAAAHGGVCWFLGLVREAHATVPAAEVAVIIDCADRAGDAQAALAAGAGCVLFTGSPAAAERLSAIACARGATVLRDTPLLLDLSHHRNVGRACREWLTAPPDVRR